MDSLTSSQRTIHPRGKSKETLKCPTCNHTHHAKTDVFGNLREHLDFDAREIFGIVGTCPICLEECNSLIALPCGHILCKADYQRLGGFVRCIIEHDGASESPENVILLIRRAGCSAVNGTYRFDCEKGRYTRLGVWDGKDAEFTVETRAVGGRKMWFLSCRVETDSDAVIDFYKAQVVDSSCYPALVRWHSAGMIGIQPLPQIEISYFD